MHTPDGFGPGRLPLAGLPQATRISMPTSKNGKRETVAMIISSRYMPKGKGNIDSSSAMQMPGKTIKKIAILKTMGAIKFTDPNLDPTLPRALRL
jgi:hypothetical protein